MRCIAESTRPPRSFAPPDDTATLRGFQETDLATITEIVSDALHEHYDASLYQSLSQEWPDGFLVAVDPTDRPVGFLLGVSQVEGEARVLMFAVDALWRKRGVGSQLMKEFLLRARARRFRLATLEVRASNSTAIRFYTRFRFSVTDLLRGYYSDGENGYQMTRPLDG